MRSMLGAAVVALVSLAGSAVCAAEPTPADLPPIVRVDPPAAGFFAKRVDCRGIAIRAHADVRDVALRAAHARLTSMLDGLPPTVAQNLSAVGAELRLVGERQQVVDMPSMRHLKGKPYKGFASVDQRGRGFGGLISITAEENLLKLPSDRFDDHRDVCAHELAHMIHLVGLSDDAQARIRAAYDKMSAGKLWPECYARTNDREYFAELSMWYFGSRGDYGQIDPAPSPGRAWLRRYDPPSFALLDDLYRGRIPVERRKWATLVRREPEDEKELRSLASTRPVVAIFVNQTGGDVHLSWLDYEGRRQEYGPLAAGGRVSQDTFATHPWLVTGAEGRTLGIYVPGPQSALVELK